MTSRQIIRRLLPLLSSGSYKYVSRVTSLITANSSVHTQTLLKFGRTLATAAPKFDCINIQDDADFQKHVVENPKPVVIDFHASWCGPCKLLGPRLEAIISKKAGDVVLAKVDIDDNMELAMQFGVQSVPTVIGMKNGKMQEMFIGLQEDDIIETFVEKLVH